MTRCAIYGRVSTSDKQNIEMQMTELREYAKSRGWEIYEYTDIGVSGAKDSRPSLNRLMADVKARKIDIVLCWKLDRLSRSLKHLLMTLDEFNALSVGFVSLKDAIDLTTPTGKLLFTLVGAFAEFERSILKDRVKSGLAHARAKGVKLGRKPIAPAYLKRIIDLHEREGLPIRKIADRVDLSHGAVFIAIKKYKQGEINREGMPVSNAA